MGKYEENYRVENENGSGEHARKVRELFHSALSEAIWVSIDELNEEIWQNNEQRHGGKVAKLNVLTESMLEYDRLYFLETHSQQSDDYRPYFYSFIIQADSLFNGAAHERLREMGDKWFLASFSKKPSPEWHEYYGEIESSASPIIYREHSVFISDIKLDPVIVDEINRTYNIIVGPTPDADIEKGLNALLGDVQFTSSRVYKVGNGNLINIIGQKGYQRFDLIFDVGYHLREYPYGKRFCYGAAIRDFQHVTPDVVFLSHWDNDHIMGCVYGRRELFDCPWIAPEIEKKNAISARRLAAYLTTKGKLTIIKREATARQLAKIVTSNSTVSFFLGENKKKHSITKENCGGMVIEISTQAVESLFCGDVPYEAVETEIWGKRFGGYDNLVVPHHGSSMDCSPLKIKAKGRAIVCGDGTSNRPHKKHVGALKAGGAGYCIEVTEHAAYPWIDLTL